VIGTVLIVDDETLVRKTLRKMIETNATGWTVVAEATNGQEALEQIKDWEPDLIFTDVQMPLMDGIQLVKWIYEQQGKSMTVILTGYRDFEYAQAAVKYGALDFLLKPSSEHEVCGLLKKLHDKLTEAKQAEQLEERLAEDNMIRALFYRLAHDESIVRRLEAKYLQASLCIVKVKSYFSDTKSYAPSDLFVLQYAVSNIVQEMCERYFKYARITLLRYDCYAVFLGPMRDEFEGAADDCFGQTESHIRELLEIEATLRNAGPIGRLQQLPYKLYDTDLNMPVIGHESGSVEQTTSSDRALNVQQLQSMENRYATYIVLGQIELFMQYLLEQHERVCGMTTGEARMEALAVATALHTISRRHLGSEELPFEYEQIIEQLHCYEQSEQIGAWLDAFVKQFNRILLDWTGANRHTGAIGQAIAYIDRHYMQSCSLQDVASSVYLNAKYFSLLFKKETGQSFTQYVTELRIERAELLLNNSDRKVTEIAQAVGYDDPNYFSTVFRKKHGISPNEYRKLQQP